MRRTTKIASAVLAGLGASAAFGAEFIINNVDAPGIGFNDPTPAVPVGGNMGTTVGEQRRIAYRRALDLWSTVLESDVTIVVQGSFAGLPCNAAGGTLAQAGALQIHANFPNAPLLNHWYGGPLANALAGADQTPGPLDPGPLAPPFNDDIVANFNGNIGQPNCIAGPGWYYGLDNNAPPGAQDFLNVFMHEVGHGLGFSTFINRVNGPNGPAGDGPLGLPDTYTVHMRDNTIGKQWNVMVPAERLASRVNDGNLVWTGPAVMANRRSALGAYPSIKLRTGDLAGSSFEHNGAQFGALPSEENIGTWMVLGEDGVVGGAGGTTTDGCEPYTANVTGATVVVDRGFCTFLVKAQVAQAAGAKALIIINNQVGQLSPGGADPSITIPVLGMRQADGATLKTGLPALAEICNDPVRVLGSDDQGRVRLYAPPAFAGGSSLSHWDVTSTPNALMEPFNSADLQAAHNVDLAPWLFQDIGWSISNLVIGSCDTGHPSVSRGGDLLQVLVGECQAGAHDRRSFRQCVNAFVSDLRYHNLISAAQGNAIKACAVSSNLPN
jgi:hypothetical protein